MHFNFLGFLIRFLLQQDGHPMPKTLHGYMTIQDGMRLVWLILWCSLKQKQRQKNTTEI